ncbi:hypothetical protein RRG08_048936 [Elysia crispata]|uniref:Uncharacterized protein n=1 Tax=Elysia crispata TaxID=231223 RepID=A0AAE0YNI0_9GAST|nr:hypothetical protein RRG08_048936 [Elysia crispata]
MNRHLYLKAKENQLPELLDPRRCFQLRHRLRFLLLQCRHAMLPHRHLLHLQRHLPSSQPPAFPTKCPSIPPPPRLSLTTDFFS